MRFFNSIATELIGYDFYCDIADRIVRARKDKGWTQADLAEKSGISLPTLAAMEIVHVKIKLPQLERLSEALDVTVGWLIDAKRDSQVGECLYLVWPESLDGFKLYQKSTSKRMAFLEYEMRMNKLGVRVNGPRERSIVKLVGVPVSENEIKDRFPKLTSDEEPIYPDEVSGEE